MRPGAVTTVLDVGVDEVSLGEAGGESGCTTHNLLEERYPWPERLTALGLHDGRRFCERYPRIAYVQGDACALPFGDGAFDVVHSNAVIEHVGGRERQEAFVREAVRVSRRVFLTTPNRWFPIEVHTRCRSHWLPEHLAGRAYDLAGKPWARENHRSALRPAGAVPGPGRDHEPRPDPRRDDMTSWLPRAALVVLAVGLALHNLAMSLLWDVGVRDTSLDAVAAWKDVLLLVALVAALVGIGSLPGLLWADRLALAYGVVVVVYWLVPQSWLGGDATGAASCSRCGTTCCRSVRTPPRQARDARPHVVEEDRVDARRRGRRALAWGLVDVYLVPLQWWRDSGVPGWFSEQLGLAYRCLSGLPENWILNTDESPARRLVSTFSSPLATAYALTVVLLLLACARRRPWTIAAGVVVYAGLLWTHARAAFLVLPVTRRAAPAARGGRACSRSPRSRSRPRSSRCFRRSGPRRRTATELACLRRTPRRKGRAPRPVQPR